LIVAAHDARRPPRFVPVAGCSIGREFVDPETGVFACELIVDHALDKGESCLFELCIDLGEPSDDTWFDHFAARRLGELLIWVRFDPARVPTRVERYQKREDGDESEDIDLRGGSSAHALARAFGPGLLGIRWIW
jgi:hypothetical protein